MSLFGGPDNWLKIESHFSEMLKTAPEYINPKDIMPGCYRGGRWFLTSHGHSKSPCLVCGQKPAEMFTFRPTRDQKWTGPVSLCKEHHREWKTDPRTKTRLDGETRREHDQRVMRSQAGRERNPAGWNEDIHETVEVVSDRLAALEISAPDVSGYTPDGCMRILKMTQELERLTGLIEQITEKLKML